MASCSVWKSKNNSFELMCNSHVTCMFVSITVQGFKSDSDSVEVLPPFLSDHSILLLN